MSQPFVSPSPDLEKGYVKMCQTLSIDIVKYITFVFYFFLSSGMIYAINHGWIFWTILHLAVMACMTLVLREIWSTRKTYEKGITVFCVLFYLSGLIAKSIDKEYFQDPYQAFFFSYSYALFERLLVDGISNIRHRILFSAIATLMRILILPGMPAFIYFVQVLMLVLSTCLELLKDNRNKHFFFSYINSREQLTKFKDLVEQHIPEAMIIVSQDLTRTLFVNKSFSKLTDPVSPDIESQLHCFILKEELNTLTSVEESFVSTSKPKKSLIDYLKTADLTYMHSRSCIVTYKPQGNELEIDMDIPKLYEVKLFSIMWDDRSSIAIILHDITQHHTILSLKIADTQKDKVLATISHELKTPLNGILGMIQIMEKKIQDSELLRFLTICKSSTNLLISLVSSVLDLNQIKANKIKLNIDTIDIEGLLKKIVSLFDYQCSQKGIYLKTNITLGTPRFIVTDKDRLSQILINLVGNAQKFTSKGGIVINVSRESENSVRFRVEDTGIGIMKGDQSKLFQVFGRISHNNEKINRQGVGLGLTISENLVQVLNNNDKGNKEITLESEYGKGSRFSFTILNRFISHQEDQRADVEENYMTSRNNLSFQEDLSEKLGQYITRTSIKLMTQCNVNERDYANRAVTLPSTLLTNCESPGSLKAVRSRRLLTQSNMSCILLVDDNTFNIAVAEHLIQSHGYTVKTALSGQNAIDLVTRNNKETEKILLILMDCQMPVMDGYEATKILKKMMMDKKIPMIPIVALTANDSEEDKEACRKAGMVDHLSKPLKDRELLKMLKKYL